LQLIESETEQLCSGARIGLCNGCLLYLNTNVLKRNGCSGPKSESNLLTNGITEDPLKTKDVDFIDRIFVHLMDLSKRYVFSLVVQKGIVQISYDGF